MKCFRWLLCSAKGGLRRPRQTETVNWPLITQRSQVQILPPLQTKVHVRGPAPVRRVGPLTYLANESANIGLKRGSRIRGAVGIVRSVKTEVYGSRVGVLLVIIRKVCKRCDSCFWVSWGAEDEIGDLVGCRLVHSLDHVAVDLQRERYRRVPKSFAHDLWIHSSSKRCGCVAVTDVV